MNERIREFLTAENKSSAQLAEEIGVQPSGISHILSGRNNPSLDFVLKMLDRYKYLSTDWLLFGKGTMYKDKQEQTLFDALVDENALVEHSSDGTEGSGKEKVTESFRELAGIAANDKHEHSGKRITKIVFFFNDNSFDEYNPKQM